MRPEILKHDESNEYFFEEGCHILELSNDPGDPEISIASARLAPGETTLWHFLKDTSERYVILQWQGLVEVGELDPETVNAGDITRIPAGCPQRIANTGDADLVFLAICSPRFQRENYVQGKP